MSQVESRILFRVKVDAGQKSFVILPGLSKLHEDKPILVRLLKKV